MMLSDKHYDREWAQKTQSLAPQKLARAKNVNVDLRWPDNGLAKSAITQEKLTRKIGVTSIHVEREVFLYGTSK
jgi:hypothetical protein